MTRVRFPLPAPAVVVVLFEVVDTGLSLLLRAWPDVRVQTCVDAHVAQW
jgi:hypothetical protein